MKQINVRRLTQVAVLIAIEIVLSRFFSISTPIAKIGFSFVPIVLVAMLYGPWYAACAYAIGDFIGAMLFPIGPYFPGFTATAFLSGLTYGVALYHRPRSRSAAIVAVLIVTIALQLGLDSIWLALISGKGIYAILPARVLKCVIIAPVQLFCIRMAGHYQTRLQMRPSEGI